MTVPQVRDSLRRFAASLASGHPHRFANAVIFKKIDSTLRGNPGDEIAICLDVFECDLAVITPAFPEMGRVVRGEYLYSDRDRDWQPVHLPSFLRAQGLPGCEHATPGALASALNRNCRYLSFDAEASGDLTAIIRNVLLLNRRILWAGSAGLASALAAALFPALRGETSAPSIEKSPVLFAIGSNHAVTAEQVTRLIGRYPIECLDAASATPESVASALSSRRHTLLTIPRETSADRLAILLNSGRQSLGALLVSGGDTAALVCRALEAQAIALEDEIVTGLPWGILEGGLAHGLPIATKSGAFGSPEALIQVADFFSCPAP